MVFVLFVMGSGCNAQPEATGDVTLSPASPTSDTAPTQTAVSPTLTPTSAVQVREVELEDVQISFWHPWTGELSDMVDELVFEFNRENTYGLQVSHESHRDRITEDLRSSATSGDSPDLIAAYPQEINGWSAFGDFVVDIHTYSDDPIWGIDDSARSELAVSVGPGLPVIGSAYYIFYNQTWAEELGFKAPPSTPDEFEDQACTASAQRNDGLGGWVVNTQPTGLLSWIYAFDGRVTNAQGEYRFNTTQVESAFTFLHGMLDKGCAWVSPELFPNQAFAERQTLFYESSVAGIPYQEQSFQDADNPDEWVLIPYPAESGDAVIVVYAYQLVVLNTAEENQLAAWVFANWLMEPERQAALAQAGGRLPVRMDSVQYVEEEDGSTQWHAALDWLPNIQSEPTQASWEDIRWALSDAGNQLFEPGTAAVDIPAVLIQLQMVAEEVQALTP